MPTRFAELFLQILHCDPARPDPMALAALTPDDWQAFTMQAIHYRLAFQVSEFLKADQQHRELVPEACLSRLNNAVRATLMRNMNQQAQLRKMLSACESAGIPFLLMKGLWLAETVYRDLKARPTGDIDLLFRPQDLPCFTRIARELGFDLPADAANLGDLAPTSNEFSLTHPTQSSHFDIHWALTHPPEEKPVDREALWQRAETVTLAGRPCQSLRLEDHLLYLCFHAVDHHRFLYVGPRALLDVARLIAEPPRQIDWEDVMARTHELGWARGVWLMLDLVREHLGVQPPQAVLDALRPEDADDPAIRAAALEAIFLDQQHRQSLGRNVVRLFDQPSLRGRVAVLRERLFIRREEMATQFKTSMDAPKIYFYWLLLKRWGAITVRVLPKLGQMVMGDHTRTQEFERARTIQRWLVK